MGNLLFSLSGSSSAGDSGAFTQLLAWGQKWRSMRRQSQAANKSKSGPRVSYAAASFHANSTEQTVRANAWTAPQWVDTVAR